MAAARPAGILLALQPTLSLAYLAAVRAERLPPSFVPVAALSLCPLAAGALVWRTPAARWVVAVAILELAWAVVAEAMIGFAIAWRSG